MPFFSTLKSVLRAPFKGEELECELDEELQSYLDLLIEEKTRTGMDPAQARRQALIELGGTEQVKARVRETRHGAALDTLLHDIRFALRTLRRSPGFAAVFVVTLAIGIGANTALFSTIKALLLSQLPYQEPDRLVASVKTYEGRNAGPISRLDFFDYRRLCRSFDGFCTLSSTNRMTMAGGERAEAVGVVYTTWDLFPTLGVPPALGRNFSEDEEDLAGANVVVIGHDLWQTRFGGSEEAIGATIHLDGMTFEVAGLVGIAVAYLFHSFLLRLLPMGDPGVPVPSIDGAVLLFALTISVATGLVVGIVPALRGTSLNVWQKLETSTRTSESKSGTRLRTVLVVVQVAMSVGLLIGCGLLIRSMVNLASVNLGFETENVIGGTYSIQTDDQTTTPERVETFTSLIAEIRAQPGVTDAAAVTKMPLASQGTDWPIWHASEPRPEPRDSIMGLTRAATPGYFSTIGIPLLRGRDFAATDAEGTAPVVIISEALARDLFPDRDPLGQSVKLGWFDFAFEIIAVVGNAKINGVRSDFDEAIYLSSGQFGPPFQWLVIRTEGDPNLLAAQIRKLVEEKDRNAILGDLDTMAALVNEDLSGFRVVMLALGLLSVVAMLLTAVGLYGVLAYHVSERTNEFGIRSALGAAPVQLTGLIMKKGLVMVGIGLAFGSVGTSLSSRLIRQFLFEIEPLDPVAYVGGALFFGTIAVVACLMPAWRAARVNPVAALRSE